VPEGAPGGLGFPLGGKGAGGGGGHGEGVAGTEYGLRLTNPLPQLVAVAVSVDELNEIGERHTTAWDASKWVIHPHGTLTLSGWQVGPERARRFSFTTERDAYATRIGRPGGLSKRDGGPTRLAFLYSATGPESPDSLGHVTVIRHRIVRQNARKIHVDCDPFDEDEWDRRELRPEGRGCECHY